MISLLANIHYIEYTVSHMSEALRQFKADIFQALAHPTRIAIVDALRTGETSASQLLEAVRVEQANLSQHLAVLKNKQVVVSRKAGNQMFYSLRDPVLLQILDLLRQYFHSHLHDTLAILGDMEPPSNPRT